MRINICYNTDSSFLKAARTLVNGYLRDNPNSLSQDDVEKKVRVIANALTNIQESTPKKPQNSSCVLDLSEDVLPEEMRQWAIAKKTMQISASIVDATELQNQEVRAQSVPPYTFANREWKDVEIVQKAHEGQRGAWFYVNSKRGSVVVKGQEDTENQLMGTVFLLCMDFKAPEVRMVDRLSPEGKQLSLLGEPHGLDARHPTHYLVMDRVKGPNYGNLTTSQEHIQLVVNNLESLGELAVYDLVLQNYDRFQLDSMSFNAGNIMFEDGRVRPIDTDCQYAEERLETSKFIIKKILDGKGNYDDKIARKLAANLGGGVNQELFSSDIIKKGMHKAIAKLIAFSQNKEKGRERFIASCKERGRESSEFPSHLEALLVFITERAKEVDFFTKSRQT